MKRRMFVLLVVALVAVFVPTLSVSAQVDPVSTFHQFMDARNQADVPGAMALVADNISYVAGSACPLAYPCTGPQAIRTDVQLFISDHAQSILIGSPLVTGTSVTGRAETSNDTVRASGFDRVIDDYTADVQDGRLTNLRVVQDASDPQTAAFQAFQRAQQPNALSTQSKDAWYLEPREALSAPAVSAQVRDRWYLERPTAVNVPVLATHVADRWYLEPTAAVSGPALSNQSRDTWYLEK